MTQTPFRSILVPVDGSSLAEQALPLALDITRRAGAMLQLAMVHDPRPALVSVVEVPTLDERLDRETRAREREYLSETEARLRNSANVPVTSVLLEGPVADALHTHVQGSGADLVIMTTHGRGPMSRFWLGSVADQLMRRSEAPVLLVRPSSTTTPPATLQRILITLDGSPFAERAVDAAVALGKPFAAEYALLMVLEPPIPIADPTGMVLLPALNTADPEVRAPIAKYLEGVAARLRKDGHTVSIHAVDGPTAAGTIISQTSTLHADLVAIASHGAGGFERLVVGSVADKVIRGSSVPTLVVRPLGVPD